MKQRLNKKDVIILISLGYKDYNLPQIDYSYSEIKCFRVNLKTNKERKIKPTTVIKKLGKKQFLAMLGRASFHHSASFRIDDNFAYSVIDDIPLFTKIPDEFFEKFFV